MRILFLFCLEDMHVLCFISGETQATLWEKYKKQIQKIESFFFAASLRCQSTLPFLKKTFSSLLFWINIQFNSDIFLQTDMVYECCEHYDFCSSRKKNMTSNCLIFELQIFRAFFFLPLVQCELHKRPKNWPKRKWPNILICTKCATIGAKDWRGVGIDTEVLEANYAFLLALLRFFALFPFCVLFSLAAVSRHLLAEVHRRADLIQGPHFWHPKNA